MANTDLKTEIRKFEGYLYEFIVERDGMLTFDERFALDSLKRTIEKYERIAVAQEELNVLKVNYFPHRNKEERL